MSNKDLSEDPKDIGERGWFYEEPGGLEVYVDTVGSTPGKPFIGTIPWRTIRAALKRKDK